MSIKLTPKLRLFAGASLLAMGITAPAAIAQEDGGDEGTKRLGTVSVTATQREESIQDVPIAITALDPEILDRAGVADVSNLQQVAPSFNMNSSDTTTGGTSLRIRGVGTTGNNIGLESSVGVFVDGVYLSRPGVALGDLMDLEQIEVLRGPQGTLFGRNTSAGALNIKTKAPTLNEFEGFGNLTMGNYALFNGQAGVNIPVIEDKLAVRISGAIRSRDGFIEGPAGDESHNRDRTLIRAQALLDLDQAGTFRAIFDRSEAEENCCHAVWFQDTTAAAAFAGGPFAATNGGAPVSSGGLDDLRSNDSAFFNPFESTGFSLEYNVDTPIGELTYLGAYRDFESETFRSTDYVSTDIFTVGRSPEARSVADGNNFDPRGNITEIETTTHELRLQNTAFDDRLDWLVGLYYSEEDIFSHGSLTLLDDYQQGVSTGLLGSPANLLNILSAGVDASGDFATNDFTQNGESVSIFTHNIFSVTDRLDVTVGARYVEESKDGRFEQTDGEFDACLATLNNIATGGVPASLAGLTGAGVALNCFIFAAPALTDENYGALLPALTNPASPLAGLGTLLPREFDDTFEDEELVYTIKLGYDLSDDVSVYGGFTHGFKSGGFNLDASAAGSFGAERGDPRFDSEKVDAWEFGMKGDFFDGRARANIAVFQQDMEDFQVLEFTGIKFETFNVGKAQATGFEIETEAQLNDYFYGGLSLTYSDTNYPDDCATQDATDPDFIPQAANLCGATLTNAPEYVLVGNLGYENQWLGNDFFANMNVRHEDDRRTSTQPTEVGSDVLLPGDIQEANTKVNLRVGLSHPDDNWTVELWGNNVTDERTKNVTFSIPLRGGAGNRARGQFAQDPATYGVTLRTKF